MKYFSLIILYILLPIICHAETELEAVAITISAEASGEGQAGIYAVACVIANRAKKYNKSPFQIVTQKNQFYGYTAKNRLKRYAEVKEYSDLLAKNIMSLNDTTKGALYFRTEKERLFSWCKVFCVKIGKHLFYK